ncbi:hypothetical protein [Nocardia sp.]|nr:hypothetical protein [Nocardia sp.]
MTDEYDTDKGRIRGTILGVRISVDGDSVITPPDVVERIEVATQ